MRSEQKGRFCTYPKYKRYIFLKRKGIFFYNMPRKKKDKFTFARKSLLENGRRFYFFNRHRENTSRENR